MTHSLIAAAGASALLLVTLHPSNAAAEDAVMRVKVGDLRLGTDVGAERAYLRIRAAAKTFCGDRGEIRSLKEHAESRACTRRMTYLAVGKLDAPLVTARYARTGAQPVILLSMR
jgi:UrcA family protein